MAKPSDFYVGTISFFAILVPGAVGIAVLEPWVGTAVLGPIISNPTSPSAWWAVGLISSYFLGHLIFLVGSYLDSFYDRIRRKRNPYTNESAYQCATQIRGEILTESEHKAANTFQWSRSILTALFPAAASDVHELEADSKFFRSLLVVFCFSGIVLLIRAKWIEGVVAFLMVVPCFARYYERRLKSTTQAYVYMIALHRLGKLTASSAGKDAASQGTGSGAVPEKMA